jgi:hypothetical protein
MIEKLNHVVIRFILLETQAFKGHMFCFGGAKDVADQIVKNLKSNPLGGNIEISISCDELEVLIEKDREKGDYPYFTLLKKTVFYGLPEEDKKIGKLK